MAKPSGRTSVLKKSLPRTFKRPRGSFGIIKIHRDRKRHEITVILSVPQFTRVEKSPTHVQKWFVNHRSFIANTLTLVLLCVGIGGLAYSAPLLDPPTTSVASIAKSASEPERVVGLPKSTPVQLEVPDVGINTELIKLGKNEDGTLGVPERYDVAGWYEFAPTPGEIGPAIIVGHVDSYEGAAVFFELKSLQPGQVIRVSREDGKIAEFKVDSVALFDQANFPTEAVYGNLDYPGLRLITCGGNFDSLSGRYSHNTVVYASYIKPKTGTDT